MTDECDLCHVYFSCSLSACADVFEKNEKKNKATSVYRLANFQ